ncbi:MAG: hypothetical protein COB09_12405 [Thalassobium sp.]|nr:MAG: hypothetical protein COB09_12405 [Thalassobium sp.]
MGSGLYCAFHRIFCLVDWHRTNAAFIQTQRSFSKQTKQELKSGFALWFYAPAGRRFESFCAGTSRHGCRASE